MRAKRRIYEALRLALLLLVMLLLVQVLLSSPPPEALPSNCWHVQSRLLWYQPDPGEKRHFNNSLHTSVHLSVLPSWSLTLLAGAGLSVEPPTFPFSHMLFMLRAPPVGISAIGDLGDFTSLFPCGSRGWILLLWHEENCYIDWGSMVESNFLSRTLFKYNLNVLVFEFFHFVFLLYLSTILKRN